MRRLWKRGPSAAPAKRSREKKPRQWKLVRRVYRFAFSGATLSVLAQGAGGSMLAAAGWLWDPIAGLIVAGVVLLIWSGRSPTRSK